MEKRQGGSKIGSEWLVLTESTGDDDKGYIHTCGATIMGAKIAHPVWDGPFPMSGSGRCLYETVPYCPECELQPSFHGTPISPRRR